jgi:hypothetical protein
MENNQEPQKIEIGLETLNDLNTARKWTMFLSVIGFIFLGLLIALGLLTGTFLSAFYSNETTTGIPDSLFIILFFALAIISFFPVIFLYRFSKHTSIAVKTLDVKELKKALKYLKRYFVYIGILVIIIIAGYIVEVILAGTSVAFLKGL